MALLYNGIVVPCDVPVSDWTEHGMRFSATKGGVRNRRNSQQPRMVVAHWSGGEGNAEQIFNTLKSRKTSDKKGLSCHLFIDYFGKVFQFADLLVATRHASAVNERSIGIEIQSRGFDVNRPLWKRRFVRRAYREQIKGKMVSVVSFTREQLVSFVALCHAICDQFNIPKEVPAFAEIPASGVTLRESIPKKYNRLFEGVVGHYHVSKAKYDPGTEPLEALLDHGFAPRVLG